MEFDLSNEERAFIAFALTNACLQKEYGEELTKRMQRLVWLIRQCGEVGCTLNLN